MKRLFWTMLLLVQVIVTGEASGVGNLANITLYDRTERKTLPVYWHEGKAYVVGRPGNEYQVALRNHAGADVLAVVSVDGVNVVTGETAAATQSGYVIDSGDNLDIKGWRKSLAGTAAFYFTELPDSYAARTGRPDNEGVVGVALFKRKAAEIRSEPPTPFSDGYNHAPQARKSAPAQAAADNAQPAAPAESRAEEKAKEKEKAKSLGTGHGRNENSQARYVNFERASSSPEEVITIYYDSRANLVARGILNAEPWREPQPFPARFVADPPRRW